MTKLVSISSFFDKTYINTGILKNPDEHLHPLVHTRTTQDPAIAAVGCSG